MQKLKSRKGAAIAALGGVGLIALGFMAHGAMAHAQPSDNADLETKIHEYSSDGVLTHNEIKSLHDISADIVDDRGADYEKALSVYDATSKDTEYIGKLFYETNAVQTATSYHTDDAIYSNWGIKDLSVKASDELVYQSLAIKTLGISTGIFGTPYIARAVAKKIHKQELSPMTWTLGTVIGFGFFATLPIFALDMMTNPGTMDYIWHTATAYAATPALWSALGAKKGLQGFNMGFCKPREGADE